jgi:hypothetical protein
MVPLTTLQPLPDDPLAEEIDLYNTRRATSFERAAYLDQLAAQRLAAKRRGSGGKKTKAKPKKKK